MIVKPGSISDTDKEKLETGGYLVIEADSKDIKIGVTSSDIDGNIMLKIALEIIEECSNYVIQAKFAKKVVLYLKEKK